jgi:hypothetical protein
MNDKHEAICLRCGTYFPITDGDILTCPKCGWSISSSDFEILWNEAIRTYRYGHQYRRVYEKQMAEGDGIREMYYLVEPPQWVIYLSLAAIAGIIGNRADHILMRALAYLFKKVPKESDIKNEREIKVIIQDSREFLDGMPEIDIKVRAAISEEERADIFVREKAKIVEALDGNDPDALKKATIDAYREAARKVKEGGISPITRARLQEVLSEVWNELPE